MYIGRVKGLFGNKLYWIPQDFYVLYNRADACPDETTLRLSDAFRHVNLPGVGFKGVYGVTPSYPA